MKILSITHCSSKKNNDAQIILTGTKMSQDSVFEFWNKKICSSRPSTTAKELYSSSGFKKLSQEASKQSELYIVSAGLGLLSGKTLVPSYDCTIAKGYPTSLEKMCAKKPNLADWWEKICKTRFSLTGISTLSNGADLLLISLTEKYLEMVQKDLELVTIPSVIFATEKNYPKNLPDNFTRAPYNDAFDGSMGRLRGTKGDLSQRCHTDFLIRLKSHNYDLSKTIETIKKDMALWPLPERGPPRSTKSDKQVADIIKNNFSKFSNKRSFLHYLRHNLKVACEEKRFNKLYSEVKGQR